MKVWPHLFTYFMLRFFRKRRLIFSATLTLPLSVVGPPPVNGRVLRRGIVFFWRPGLCQLTRLIALRDHPYHYRRDSAVQWSLLRLAVGTGPVSRVTDGVEWSAGLPAMILRMVNVDSTTARAPEGRRRTGQDEKDCWPQPGDARIQ